MKTREEVDELKWNWRKDPCWDIYETEGYEDYRDELKAYQDKVEKFYGDKRQKELEDEKAEAEKLGLYGLYAKIKKLEELEHRHYQAIQFLTDGKAMSAYNALRGDPDYL